MSLSKVFVKDPDNFAESMEKIRLAGKPDLFDKSHLLALGFEETNAILYVRLFVIMGLLDEKGKPESDFDRFIKSDKEARTVITEKIWNGYTDVFSKEAHAYDLPVDKVSEIFRSIHGSETSDTFIQLLSSTFKALSDYANWNPKKETAVVNGTGKAYLNGSSNGSGGSHTANAVEAPPQIPYKDAYETDFLQDLMDEFADLEYEYKKAPAGDEVAMDGKESSEDEMTRSENESAARNETVNEATPDRESIVNEEEPVKNKTIQESARDTSKKGQGVQEEIDGVIKSMTVADDQPVNSGQTEEIEQPANKSERSEPFDSGAEMNNPMDRSENDTLSKALLKRADLLLKLNRKKEAVEAYDQIVSFYDGSDRPDRDTILSQSILRKAEILEEEQNFEQALSAYEDIITRFNQTGKADS